MSFGGVAGGLLQDKDNLRTEVIKPGFHHIRFLIGRYSLAVKSTRCVVESRTIGDAFILGHASNGVLGTSALGSGTMGSWVTAETLNETQTLPDSGRIEIARWLGGETANDPTHISLGTGTSAFQSDDDTLGSEKFRRALDSTDVTSDAKIVYQMRIRSTDDQVMGEVVREVGLTLSASNSVVVDTGLGSQSLDLTLGSNS